MNPNYLQPDDESNSNNKDAYSKNENEGLLESEISDDAPLMTQIYLNMFMVALGYMN